MTHFKTTIHTLVIPLACLLSAPGFALTNAEIDGLIAEMTVEEKVGQLMIVGLAGKQADKTIREHIGQRFIGGVTLFNRNIQSPQQVAQLTNELQRLAQATKRQIPLFIAVDQEGGWVTRLKKGATILPGNMALGATDSTELAERAGEITAIELSAVGINLNFAPVVDVNNNPNNPVIDRRAFGESPEQVSRLGAAYIRGLQENGLLATAKHFPGHGDTTVDSHTALPTVKHDLDRIRAIELKPFRATIEAGVSAIMTAHIVYSALDAERPATLSRLILTNLLREELGFDGLIITDDMEMKAIDDRYPAGEAAVMAVEAGADIVLTLWTPTKQRAVYAALLAAVKRGRISKGRLDASVRRILKGKRAWFDRRFVDPNVATKIVGNSSHKQLAQTIASRAITIVKNRNRIVPLKLETETDILILHPSRVLFNLFNRRHANSTYVQLPKKPDPEGILPQLTRQADRADFVIAGVENHRQAKLIHQLGATTRTPIIAVAFASPYTLPHCRDVHGLLAAYDGHYASVLAAVEVILGKRTAAGKLPIRLGIAE